jgi:hypothetical protein
LAIHSFSAKIFYGLYNLKKLTSGFIKGWKKGKLKENLKETSELAIEEQKP